MSDLISDTLVTVDMYTFMNLENKQSLDTENKNNFLYIIHAALKPQ